MKNILYLTVKRIFDLCCCIIGMPFFILIFIGIALAIKIEDRGPIFYKAERIGKDCKKLYMYKFRSMKVNCENILNPDGSTYNSKDDPRVTRVGRFIRATSLDETAQLINVLLGQMSAIGPRASGWTALESYQPDEMDKMKVRPGITGYTQAYYRNSISVREKRLLDAWYANNASLWLDIKILFKTVQTVLMRENVYTNDSVPISNENKLEKNKESIVEK